MKKELIASVFIVLIFLTFPPVAMAWQMERPSWSISNINERIENVTSCGDASVGIGVHVQEFDEDASKYGGNDYVTLRLAATANTRKGITYKYITYDYLWDWIEANQPTGITQDNEGAWFNLPFPVRFYGGPGAQGKSFTYTKVWVCSNGFLSFDNSNSTSANSVPFGNPTKPNALMAVYWTDLNPTGGSIKYYADGNQFVVLWDNVLNKNNGYRETFEVVIKNERTPEYRDQNKFMFLYENVSGWGQVGIEDQEGYKYTDAYATSGKEIFWTTEHRAGEIKEMVIIVEKSDGSAEIWMTSGPFLRGYNMNWKSEEGDSEGLYSVALKGGLTLLLTEAAGMGWGPIGGLSMELLLLSIELAPYFSRELYKVHELDIEHASTTEPFAYVNASAKQDYNQQWPVDAELSDTIEWVFTDDDGTHSIKLTALLKYYSFESYSEEIISTSVDVTLVPDAGSTRATARTVTPGNYLAYAHCTRDVVDYYKVWVQSAKWINVLMTPPEGQNFDLFLYDKYGNELDSSEESGDDIEHVYYKADYTGYYYVKEYATLGDGLYDLEVKVQTYPPGGCPFICPWNGRDYVVDNNLLASSEISNGADVEDYYRLEQPLLPKYKTKLFSIYSLQLREFENEHSYMDQVKLLAVDHQLGIDVGVTPTGEILTYKNPHSPITCIDNNGNDLLDVLRLPDNQYYVGYADDYILLDFGALDTSNGAKLVLRTDWPIMPKCPCIKVQVLDSTGNWIDVTTISPRVYWATDIVDLFTYLSSTNEDIKIRLYFTNIHKIDYIGLDTTSQTEIHVTYSHLISAIHSEEGPVTFKLLRNDKNYAELVPNQQMTLTFLLPRNPKHAERTFIFYTEGHYHTITPENP